MKPLRYILLIVCSTLTVAALLAMSGPPSCTILDGVPDMPDTQAVVSRSEPRVIPEKALMKLLLLWIIPFAALSFQEQLLEFLRERRLRNSQNSNL
jgi:hypothetical protein